MTALLVGSALRHRGRRCGGGVLVRQRVDERLRVLGLRGSRITWYRCRARRSRPSRITATVSASADMTPRSCVTSRMARPRSSHSSRSSRRMPGLHGDVERRRRLVGDEHRRVAGDGDAIAMRCSWPPENWCGYLLQRRLRVGHADPLEQLDARASRASGFDSPRWWRMWSVSCHRSRAWGAGSRSGPGRPSRSRVREGGSSPVGSASSRFATVLRRS